MTVSPELARIYASAPYDEGAYETLHVTHPFFSQEYFITNEQGGFWANLETGENVEFGYTPFEIKLPNSGSNGFQDLLISLSNVSRRFIDELENASEMPRVPVSFVYRAYAAGNLTQPGAILPAMQSTEVTIDETTVSTQATIVDLVNRAFPYQLYTTVLFPMLGNI